MDERRDGREFEERPRRDSRSDAPASWQRDSDDEPIAKEWQLHLAQPPPGGTDAKLLKLCGVDVEELHEPPLSLWQALELRDDDAALELIAADPEQLNALGGPYSSTPLGWAAMLGRAPLVEALLQHKADPSVPAQRGSYPLHMATWNGDHLEVVQMLLQAGAKPHDKNAQGQTALEVARQMEAVELSSTLDATYALDAWRSRWGKPASGRARVIAALIAASEEAAEKLTDDAVGRAAHTDDALDTGDGSEAAALAKDSDEAIPDADGAFDTASTAAEAGGRLTSALESSDKSSEHDKSALAASLMQELDSAKPRSSSMLGAEAAALEEAEAIAEMEEEDLDL